MITMESWVYSMDIDIKNINVEKILFSGSCFRSIKEEDGSITNILDDRVINIKQDGNIIHVLSNNYKGLKDKIYEYFDLNRDYELINKELIDNNKDLEEMINLCKDYRILNQNPFEMSISYIISQNNSVKKISSCVEKISKLYGNKIIFNDKEYYLFPNYEQLKNVSAEEFRKIGVGFRDKYIRNYLDYYNELLELDKMDTSDALEKLMNVKGIGLKVASCILLFGYKRLDVFPIDTWVKKYISDNYNIKNDQKSIENFAKNNFKEYSGLVIQYMFHSKRNN